MIVDCFSFLNEFDVLNIRLNILKDYVDKFVIVESDKTFAGYDKPLFFDQNKNSYKEYNIKHLVFKGKNYKNIKNIKDNEVGQKNYLKHGFNKDDVVLFGDVDEIPDLKNNSIVPGTIFNMGMFYYYLNMKRSNNWLGTIVLNGDDVGNGLYKERQMGKEKKIKYKKVKGGWHFSYIGGEKQVKYKLDSFEHLPQVKKMNKQNINKHIKEKTDIFNRNNEKFDIVDMQELPIYIQNNYEKYKSIIL